MGCCYSKNLKYVLLGRRKILVRVKKKMVRNLVSEDLGNGEKSFIGCWKNDRSFLRKLLFVMNRK